MQDNRTDAERTADAERCSLELVSVLGTATEMLAARGVTAELRELLHFARDLHDQILEDLRPKDQELHSFAKLIGERLAILEEQARSVDRGLN